MKKSTNQLNGIVEFTFEGDLPKVTVVAADLDAVVREHAMLHGLSQKIGDSAAISKTEENGYMVTEAMRRDAVLQMVAQLTAGDWNAKVRAPTRHPSIVKLAAKWGCTYEEAEIRIASLDDI
jgi:hypothetical protein